MEENNSDILSRFNIWKVIWPVLIGILVTVGYIIYKDIIAGDGEVRKALESITWTGRSFLWIGLGFLMMFLRDAAYIWRMRMMTNNTLSWRSCFDVTLLWEFFSAMSPSVVGGSAFAVYMLYKEKVTMGKSTAIVFITIFLDEVFYLLILPFVLLFIGFDQIFEPIRNLGEYAGDGLIGAFWIAYCAIFIYTIFLALALFIRPEGTNNVIKKLSFTRLFRRWKRRGVNLANELLLSSQEFKTKSWRFWLWTWIATVIAWMGRYLVLNCVVAAFAVTSMSFGDHVLAFAREAVMFIVMLVSPTPGGSGFAEVMFTSLLEDLTPVGLGIALAALWRLITYYPYLFIGFILLPRWTRRIYGKGKKETPVSADASAVSQ